MAGTPRAIEIAFDAAVFAQRDLGSGRPNDGKGANLPGWTALLGLLDCFRRHVHGADAQSAGGHAYPALPVCCALVLPPQSFDNGDYYLQRTSGTGRCFDVAVGIAGEAFAAHSVNINMSPVRSTQKPILQDIGLTLRASGGHFHRQRLCLSAPRLVFPTWQFLSKLVRH